MAGIVLAVLGAAVLIVAIVALRHPDGRGTAAGTATRTIMHTVTSTQSAPAARTPSTSKSASGSGSTTASTSHTSTGSSSAATARKPLIVLNNTTVSGLAAAAAQRFEGGGWTVTRYGNLRNNILSTCAYYDPAISGAQQGALALQHQYPTIKRVEPKFDGLPAGPIVVVLTPDYQ